MYALITVVFRVFLSKSGLHLMSHGRNYCKHTSPREVRILHALLLADERPPMVLVFGGEWLLNIFKVCVVWFVLKLFYAAQLVEMSHFN